MNRTNVNREASNLSDHDKRRDRPPVAAHLNYQRAAARLKSLSLPEVFEEIYQTNLWDNPESRSGPGSALAETAAIREGLVRILHDFEIRSLLDVPCGDFAWMRSVPLADIDYTGADIVQALVERNNAAFGGPGRRFLHLDLTDDALPTADLILCRDCLVHLSFENICRALANMHASGARYLLTTTFIHNVENRDAANGDWRMLNFELPPFEWPSPLVTIVEGCTEANGAYDDKALALWGLASVLHHTTVSADA